MANLIKSHSNYVLKKKHQNVSDGTIWERDITTIGRVNYFAPGQTPIYRDNNFIITVRNDSNVANQYNQSKWVESKNTNNKIWTLEDVNSVTSDLDEQDDTKIVIKQDYYDFCDFAYYGSLTELFRSSITDIINRFPGELYGSKDNVYYETTEVIDGESFITSKIIGGKTYYELKNPFGINLHSSKKPDGANPLKYFANNGYSAYTINGAEITSWVVSKIKSCPDAGARPGKEVGTVTINGDYKIHIYAGTNGTLHYMHTNMNGIHIKPKKSYLEQFYNECDSFQRLLMNPETTPKYKADFSVIYENDYGYYRKMESFIFPTSDGGYNIDPTAYGFNDYTARFARIGEFYDERFTDNMWRSMTHEAIKNFDWTYTREYVESDVEEYVLGGERMQKALRVFAREFDETKAYIDNINGVNKVTYDDRGNLPNYFLTDTCENDGWDVIQVMPYFTTSAMTKSGAIDVFTQDSKKFVTPYSGESNPYFITCCSAGTTSLSVDCRYGFSTSNTTPYYSAGTLSTGCKKIAKVGQYKDTERTYTYMDVNNEFLRRLKLNSRYIWRHKGTIEGIEMILAMFGLKSERWCKKLSADTACKKLTPDYTITEYTRSTSGITDEWDEVHQMHKYDWVNSTKTINYDYRTISTYNPKGNIDVSYIPYQGLPVKYIDKDGKRYLYPNFEKYEQYDGNPYFQMNGGWLAKTVNGNNVSGTVVTYGFQYDNDGQPLFVSGDTLYKETVRSIRRVKDLSEMLSIPSSQLKNGSICYVETVDDNVLIVDGEVFKIHEKGNKKFIILTRSGGLIKVGDKYFDDKITVYNKDGVAYTYTLDDKLDGYEVYAYIDGNNFICKNGSYSVDLYKVMTNSDTNNSNYFKLNDIEYSNSVAVSSTENGWLRLNKNSCDYKRINTIWNYYKGNNPHNGNLSYDKGEEYYEYFRHLFKYPYENDLFDDRCYDNYYKEIDKAYSGATFNISSGVTADTKVHYFGNYYSGSSSYDNDTSHSGIAYPMDSGSVMTYSSDSYSFIDEISAIIVDEEQNPYLEILKNDKITNQIMNDKRIRLSFNMKNAYNVQDRNSKDYKGKSELKFIDEIVMNYLTQLVPSNAIFEVEYKFEKGGLPTNYCK